MTEGTIRKGMFVKRKHQVLKMYFILKEEFLSLYQSEKNINSLQPDNKI